MQHTVKTVDIPAGGVGEPGHRDAGVSWRVVACRNLRPGTDAAGCRVLSSVGRPAAICTGAHYTPLGSVGPDGRQCAVLWRDGRIYAAGADGSPAELGDVGAAVQAAVHGGDKLWLTAADRLWTVSHDGTGAQLRAVPAAADFHGAVLRAVDATMVSAEIAARRLSRVYGPGDNSLDRTDHDKVTEAFAEAYRTMARAAAGAGMFLQPVVGRYVVSDADGHPLYASAPVLLSNSEGPQCTDVYTLRSLDRQTTEPLQITAKCWRPQLVLPPGGLPEAAATVDILLTPQLHPYSLDAPAGVGVSRSAGTEFLRVSMPGVGTALNTAYPDSSRGLLSRVTEVFDTLARSAATLDARSTAGAVTLPLGADRSLAAEQRLLARTLERQTSAAVSLPGLLQAPHSFSARSGSFGPIAVLWGGLTARRYGGYPLSMFGTSTIDSSWRGWAAVEFADGSERVVWQGGGETAAPRLLMPLLSYPSADAVRITVWLQTGTQTAQTASFPLRPFGAGCAAYLHPSLRPFVLEAATGQLPTAPAPLERLHEYPGMLAAASALAPLSLTSVLRPGCGEVRAVATAAGSQSAWDFGRPRFYACCASGIIAVSATADLRRLSATPVDGRRVSGPSGLCSVDGQVYAVASGDLVRMQGNRVVTVRRSCGYTSVAWASQRRELVGLRQDGTLEYSVDGSRFELDWRLGGCCLATDNCGRILMGTPGAVYDLTDERYGAGGVDIRWQVELHAEDGSADGGLLPGLRPTAMELQLGAASFSGTVSLTRGHYLATATRPDAGIRIKGRIGHPLHIPVHTRPATSWLIDITARVTAGQIHRIKITNR